jgi:hypothetical protein
MLRVRKVCADLQCAVICIQCAWSPRNLIARTTSPTVQVPVCKNAGAEVMSLGTIMSRTLLLWKVRKAKWITELWQKKLKSLLLLLCHYNMCTVRKYAITVFRIKCFSVDIVRVAEWIQRDTDILYVTFGLRHHLCIPEFSRDFCDSAQHQRLGSESIKKVEPCKVLPNEVE